jgi:hypothetical protein
LAIDPWLNDPRTDPVLTVVLLAQAYAAVGDAAGAEQVLCEAAAARPDQVVLLDALGKLLERRGRLGAGTRSSITAPPARSARAWASP